MGARLDFFTRTVLEGDAASLHLIFGSPDDMKFRSCPTLFALAAGEEDNPFRRTLDRGCDGRPDDRRSLSFVAIVTDPFRPIRGD